MGYARINLTKNFHLKQVPFDPFLPWIFMGEEISMSARYATRCVLLYVCVLLMHAVLMRLMCLQQRRDVLLVLYTPCPICIDLSLNTN